jgi:acyl dehydratase
MTELDDLIGQELGTGEWFTVTQDMIDKFAEVTFDNQWIHVDVERATRELPTKGTIAHGYYTLSMVPKLLASTGHKWPFKYKTVINYGLEKLRFTNAVPVGSRIRAKLTMVSYKNTPVGVLITNNVVVEIENLNKPALSVDAMVLYVLS